MNSENKMNNNKIDRESCGWVYHAGISKSITSHVGYVPVLERLLSQSQDRGVGEGDAYYIIFYN
jgi:hypothetical protein